MQQYFFLCVINDQPRVIGRQSIEVWDDELKVLEHLRSCCL